jgi:nitroreductase
MDLIETLRTTPAVREFSDQAVDDRDVARILDVARFAPNGGNRQGWRVILVKDPARRAALRDLYLPGWYDYLAMSQAGLTPWAPVTDRAAETTAREHAGEIARTARSSGNGRGGFAENLDRVPVMLMLLADLRRLAAVDRDLDRYTLVGGASIYPFAWSVLLAARSMGLGGVMTTMVVEREAEVRSLLDVPDHFAVAALIVLGHPVRHVTRLRRDPVEDFATVDSLGGPPLTSPPS